LSASPVPNDEINIVGWFAVIAAAARYPVPGNLLIILESSHSTCDTESTDELW
jgi:hypothetical protein